jgi:succinate-acetate transporter protein
MNNVSSSTAGSASRAAITATVGYMCIALITWALSMTNAGWFGGVFARGASLLAPLSVVLAIVGILAFVSERTLDAVVFLGSAGMFWGDHAYVAAAGGAVAAPPSYDGWIAFIWAVYFFYVWLGARRADPLRMLFLLALWLTLLGLALGHWATHVLGVVGGYLGLLAAILAALISASAIIAQAAAEASRPGRSG